MPNTRCQFYKSWTRACDADAPNIPENAEVYDIHIQHTHADEIQELTRNGQDKDHKKREEIIIPLLDMEVPLLEPIRRPVAYYGCSPGRLHSYIRKSEIGKYCIAIRKAKVPEGFAESYTGDKKDEFYMYVFLFPVGGVPAKEEEWIETFSGEMVSLPVPEPEQIHLADIAHGLSYICRFGGQCEYYYSVAQHSINVASEIKHLGLGARLCILGLYHDAAEAYVGDLQRPLKTLLPEYKTIEKSVQGAIWKSLNLQPPTEEEEKIIKQVDEGMMGLEAGLLMKCRDGWNAKYLEKYVPTVAEITEKAPRVVEAEFERLASEYMEELKRESAEL